MEMKLGAVGSPETMISTFNITYACTAIPFKTNFSQAAMKSLMCSF
jgi:hypothetical protein